ncbi:MAG: DUF362 domain-containing protein [Candidatus Paceibacterota bacterium]
MPFYKCLKCGRIWQYPLSECPYCLVELKQLVSEKAKVSSISKVMIPTLRHPFVPYFVFLIEDENKNKWVYKSIKELNQGDFLSCDSDSEAIAVWRIKYDYLQAIKKAIQLIQGVELNENSKILILPSLFSASQNYLRENTSPEFLQAVIEYLLKNKVKIENIKIASQSFNEIPIEAMAERSGLLKICLKNKITPFDLNKSNFVKQGDWEISEEALKADLVINLGISQSGRAKTTENIFRILKKENYLGLKYLFSEKEIAQNLEKNINNLINLSEADYIRDKEGYIFYLGIILAGKSYLKLDRVFNEIIMNRENLDLVADIDFKEISLVGRDLKEVQFDLNKI